MRFVQKALPSLARKRLSIKELVPGSVFTGNIDDGLGKNICEGSFIIARYSNNVQYAVSLISGELYCNPYTIRIEKMGADLELV